jgi:drug/metabolite transporter (DMT)-like permease
LSIIKPDPDTTCYLWELIRIGPFPLTGGAVLSVLFATFRSIVAYFCSNQGVEQLGPNRAGSFINLIPLFASLLSVWLLGETVRPFHLAGMAMIFAEIGSFSISRG